MENERKYLRYSWKYTKDDFKYCPRCRSLLILEDLHIQNQPQLVCDNCEFILYLDPKLAVAALVTYNDQILLLKRAEEPNKGLWAFPGGHVERGQDLFDAIKNEVYEEAGIIVEIGEVIKTFSYPSSGLIQLTYRAISHTKQIKVNLESEEGRFFRWDKIPWDNLAFQSTKEALEDYASKNSIV